MYQVQVKLLEPSLIRFGRITKNTKDPALEKDYDDDDALLAAAMASGKELYSNLNQSKVSSLIELLEKSWTMRFWNLHRFC